MRISRFLAMALSLAVTAPIAAQQEPRVPEVIRGKVIDDSGHVVIGATVMVTRGPDRLTQQSATDSTGHYVVRFAEGTGDYLVYVAAPGLKAVRRRVTRAT